MKHNMVRGELLISFVFMADFKDYNSDKYQQNQHCYHCEYRSIYVQRTISCILPYLKNIRYKINTEKYSQHLFVRVLCVENCINMVHNYSYFLLWKFIHCSIKFN